MSNVITVKQKGDFKHLDRFFRKMKEDWIMSLLDTYGKKGVIALSAATPVDSGKTAASWTYEVRKEGSGYVLGWNNGNVSNGWFNVAIMLQMGHGTRNGGYVAGRDYINPALQPIFDQIAQDAWMEVVNA